MRTFVTAVFMAKDGKGDALEQIFRRFVEPTHSDEGCISYALNRDQDNPRRLVFMEEWESRELLEKHLDTKHIKDGLEEANEKGLIETQDIIVLERIAGGEVKA